MGLVDDEQLDPQLREDPDDRGVAEGLRVGDEDLSLPVEEAPEDFSPLLGALAPLQHRRLYPVSPQPEPLLLHQPLKRVDYQGRAAEQRRRKEEAEALPIACGEYHQLAPPPRRGQRLLQDVVHHEVLARFDRPYPEPPSGLGPYESLQIHFPLRYNSVRGARFGSEPGPDKMNLTTRMAGYTIKPPI